MRKDGTSAANAARTRRIAWLVSFVVPLVVLALMLVALKPAHATTAGAVPGGALTAPPAVAALDEPAEEEGEAEEPEVEFEEACEEAEETEEAESEAEAGEAEEEAEGCKGSEATNPVAPAECLLRTARAQVLVDAAQDRVRLLVAYTSSAHPRATVAYSLEDASGSLALGHATRKLANRGVLRLSRQLTRAQMAKVRAAKSFTVELRVPTAPRSCRRFETRRLTAKHTTHSETVWSQAR